MSRELQFEGFDESSFADVRDRIDITYKHLMSQANPRNHPVREHFFPQVNLEEFVADDFRAALAEFPKTLKQERVNNYSTSSWIHNLSPSQRRKLLKADKPTTIESMFNIELKTVEHYAKTVRKAIEKAGPLRLLFYGGHKELSSNMLASLFPDLAKDLLFMEEDIEQNTYSDRNAIAKKMFPSLYGGGVKPNVLVFRNTGISMTANPFKAFMSHCTNIEKRMQVETTKQNIEVMKAPVDYLLDEIRNIDKYDKLQPEERLALQAYSVGLLGNYLSWMASATLENGAQSAQSYQIVLNLVQCANQIGETRTEYDPIVTPDTKNAVAAQQKIQMQLHLLQGDFHLMLPIYGHYSREDLQTVSPFDIPENVDDSGLRNSAYGCIGKGADLSTKSLKLDGTLDVTAAFLDSVFYRAFDLDPSNKSPVNLYTQRR